MPDIIVIGSGPAGITAAIYAARAGMDTLVIGKDKGSLQKAGLIENYYGFPEPVSGVQLIQNGIDQAKKLGVKITEDEVVGLQFGEKLVVKTKEASYEADAVIVATGSSRKKPEIKGLADLEGKGVSYCATCDAFFYKNKDVAVLGDGEYALSEAKELMHVVQSVRILTNGKKMQAEAPGGIAVSEKEIECLEGTDKLECIRFKDGTQVSVSGAFVAMGVASSSDLARMMGIVMNKSEIIVNENMETNVPGVFAAGDCTGGWLQVSKAVHEGAMAGSAAVKYIRGNRGSGAK
ncbi:MAG: NAD(P)/FAD-dependent oxidoreductase [Eubacteriales bacterium]